MASTSRHWLLLALGIAVGAGCYGGNQSGYGIAGGGNGSGGGGGGGGGGGSNDGALTGVPCDVSDVVQTHCLRCHDGRAMSASSLPLTSYDDLVAPSPRNSAQTVAELALSRINDASRPMPPEPEARLTSDEIRTFSDWVSSGMPVGECGGGPGGIGDGVDAGPGPYETATVCTSGSYWRWGNEESWDMHPGRACISCHSGGGGGGGWGEEEEEGGPLFDVAGTVYPTAHEPDDCNGTGGITVVITDARGRQVVLDARSSGNFAQGRLGLSMPYTAKVVRDGRERAMTTAQTNGDCNSCHTESGTNDAPGRIMAP